MAIWAVYAMLMPLLLTREHNACFFRVRRAVPRACIACNVQVLYVAFEHEQGRARKLRFKRPYTNAIGDFTIRLRQSVAVGGG